MLAAALDALPRKLSWGQRGDAEMARSKRKYFHLTPEAIELAVRGGDGVTNSRSRPTWRSAPRARRSQGLC
jgi:hypothetical protein